MSRIGEERRSLREAVGPDAVVAISYTTWTYRVTCRYCRTDEGMHKSVRGNPDVPHDRLRRIQFVS